MAATLLRNPKPHLTKTLTRLLSTTTTTTTTTSSSDLLSSHRQAKSSIRSETDPSKIAQLFLQTTTHSRSYRDRALFHLSVKKLTKSKRFDLVEQILHHQSQVETGPKTEGFWIRIIMLYSDARMLDHSIATFDKIEQKSEKSLCAILTACLYNTRYDLVHEYFTTAEKNLGFVPGVVASNLVMRAFCAEKKFDEARALLGSMKERNVASYNVMLTAYLRNGEEGKFDELYKEFVKEGLEPNLVTYNLRLSRLCKNKECVRAKKMVEEMIGKGVKPNINSFNVLIDGFCRIADFESAKKIFERMKSKVVPDDEDYICPNSDSYNTFIKSLVQEGEFESALEMCKESLERKWVPPFSVMKDLVNGLVKLSKVDEAKEIVESMKKRLRGSAPEVWEKVEALLPLQ